MWECSVSEAGGVREVRGALQDIRSPTSLPAETEGADHRARVGMGGHSAAPALPHSILCVTLGKSQNLSGPLCLLLLH